VDDGTTNVSNLFHFTTDVHLQPVVSGVTPANNSLNNQISLAVWNATVEDPAGKLFNVTIETSPDVGSMVANLEANGSKQVSLSGLSYNTTYTVFLNITDYLYSTKNYYYTFTTRDQHPPAFQFISNKNNSVDNMLSFDWTIDIYDEDGDTFDWTIECNNSQSDSDIADSNGTKKVSLSGLVYSTTYTMWVNATDDSVNYTRAWYQFVTSHVPGVLLYNNVPFVCDNEYYSVTIPLIFDIITISDHWLSFNGLGFNVTYAGARVYNNISSIVSDPDGVNGWIVNWTQQKDYYASSSTTYLISGLRP
jgi:hypothetical protein